MAAQHVDWADEAENDDTNVSARHSRSPAHPGTSSSIAGAEEALAQISVSASAGDSSAASGAPSSSNERQQRSPTAASADRTIGDQADDDTDVPDKSIRHGLREADAGEVQKTLADGAPGYATAGTWKELSLPDKLLEGITVDMKFARPSRVQAETLPLMLTPPYKDLIAQAHNGSGKTTCFAISMLARVDESIQMVQAMCLCPTRELTVQNTTVVQRIARRTGIRVGSNADKPPFAELNQCQVVLATPKGMQDMSKARKRFPMKCMRVFVLDEADQLLNSNDFRTSTVQIIESVRSQAGADSVQLLLFSATFEEGVKAYADKKVKGANKILLPREQLSLDLIKSHWIDCSGSDDASDVKDEILRKILKASDRIGQAIIFTATRKNTHKLQEKLSADGWSDVDAIAGDLNNETRDAVVEKFRNMQSRILISTDVLARGFDQETVTLIVNYDLPMDHQDKSLPNYDTYLHRIGRSGRFGRRGIAFNLCRTERDKEVITMLEEHFSSKIPKLSATDEDALEQALENAELKTKDT
jgi:ATP-dependent RNA helicase DDX19/DBP5